MGSRGRKSADSLQAAVLPSGAVRPDAPYSLSDKEAAAWRTIVDAMPDDWFKPESHALLEAHCRHVERERLLARAMQGATPESLDDLEKVKYFDALAKACERESRAILATARALRITHQSRYDDRQAARQRKKFNPDIRPPWLPGSDNGAGCEKSSCASQAGQSASLKSERRAQKSSSSNQTHRPGT